MKVLIRRLFWLGCVLAVVGGAGLFVPRVRSEVKALVWPEEPPPLTPLAVVLPPTVAPATPTTAASATSLPGRTPVEPTPAAEASALVAQAQQPTSTPQPTAEPTATVAPAPTATPGPIVVNGRTYDAYIPAVSKEGQAYQYSCEFDAAWVIVNTYGIPATVDDLIALVGVDSSIEPYLEESPNGFIIRGGNIVDTFSGDYRTNFLARSSATAIRKGFDHYGLRSTLVSDRAGVEAALRAGSLVWVKVTVDFKPWRPATWVMPDGRTHRTVVGNDHAVVVIGFNDKGVVIRDVLGPTSTNRERPYEYEVDWATFLASWEAQSFDGIAIAPSTAP